MTMISRLFTLYLCSRFNVKITYIVILCCIDAGQPAQDESSQEASHDTKYRRGRQSANQPNLNVVY
jgi:hypothetical protein